MTRTADKHLRNAYHNMLRRCYDPRHISYPRYRALGVADEWRDSWHTFRDWAIQNGFQDGLSLDRIDGELGYAPSNCRWTTAYVQARNRRSTIRVDGYDCLKDFAAAFGLPYQSVWVKYHNGWSIADIRRYYCIG